MAAELAVSSPQPPAVADGTTPMLRIRDHAGLQGAAVRATCAGALGGVVGWLWPGPLAQAVTVALVGGAAALPRSWRSLATLGALGVGAVAAAHLGGAFAVPLFLVLGGLIYARDLDGNGRRTVAAGAGALALAAGWFVAARLGGEAVALLGGLGAALVGAARGFIAGLGATGRELEVVSALPPAPAAPVLGGEIGGLLARAGTAFAAAREALGEATSEASVAATDLMGKIERFARRWGDLETELGNTDRAALADRLGLLAKRADEAGDDVVKSEYAAARDALAKQVDYLGEIERGRDRAVARLHHHVAVLERLRLAALHHRATVAGRAGEELAPVVEDLVAAGRDLDTAAEAIAELPALSTV